MSSTKESFGRKPPGTKPQSGASKARQADALRENLRRRKAQERARAENAPPAAETDDPEPGAAG